MVNTSRPVAKDDTLYLAGGAAVLRNWNPSGLALTRKTDTSFECVAELEVGEDVEFKITRGTWETVERDADGNDIANRAITVKAGGKHVVVVESWADEHPSSDPSTVVGTVEIHRITSIEPPRLVRVWLPAAYHDTTRSYPVLYMLDGQNVFDRATSAIGQEWGVDETLTELIESNTVQPMIVVAVDNSSRRMDEYTSISDDQGQRTRGGMAEPFAKWIVEKLKPQIDLEYRTQGNRETTWIGGSSLGGLFTLYSVVQYNDTFGGAIAMSPSLGWGNEGIFSWIESSQTLVTKPTRIWVDFGGKEGATEDAARGNMERFQRFQEMLKSIAQNQNMNLVLDGGLFPEAKHQETAWRERFSDAIQFIAR